MKVVKANRHTRVCEALVPKPMSFAHSRDWHNRVLAAERAGRDPCQCARTSAYLLDGVPMCANHAGQAALRHLMEAGR